MAEPKVEWEILASCRETETETTMSGLDLTALGTRERNRWIWSQDPSLAMCRRLAGPVKSWGPWKEFQQVGGIRGVNWTLGQQLENGQRRSL